MAVWIGVSITVLLFIAAVIGFYTREKQWQTRQEARDKALDKKIDNKIDGLAATVELKITGIREDMDEVKQILGNGHGLRHDVNAMKTLCAGQTATIHGEIKEIRTRLSAQQHEIDEVKGRK